MNQTKLLQLDDVFQLNEDSIKNIRKLIMKELHSNQKISDYIFDDLAKDALEKPDKWKWSGSRDKVTFHFDEYEIAAGAAGVIKAEIPMKKIKPYLNENFAKRIDVKIPMLQPLMHYLNC